MKPTEEYKSKKPVMGLSDELDERPWLAGGEVDECDGSTIAERIQPRYESGIHEILEDGQENLDEDIRNMKKTLSKFDDFIRKAEKRFEFERLLNIDTILTKAESCSCTDRVDDFDLVKSGVERSTLIALQKAERPPREWWENCLKKAEEHCDDSADFCGKMWSGDKDMEKSQDFDNGRSGVADDVDAPGDKDDPTKSDTRAFDEFMNKEDK